MNRSQREYAARNRAAVYAATARYDKEHPQSVARRARRYKEKYPERRKAINRAYYLKNKQKFLLRSKDRRAKIKGSSGTFTVEQWERIKRDFAYGCARCLKPEQTIDHVTPLSLGGAHCQTNIQPLCMECNRWKGARFMDFRAIPG
jgi:5-methylcytosine-specific restriction endonuclease McrA